MSERNSAYSPLPQSNSDSEGSSEELHAAQESRIINRVSKSKKISPENSFSEQKSKTINYKLLDADGDIGAALIRFQPTADEVSILKPNNTVEIFSTSRKLCFVLSLLLCIFTTVVFIWFLPCNEGTCFSASPKTVILSWERTLDNLELYGPIGLFSDASGKMQNLVFLTKKPFDSDSNNNGKKTGLIMLKGDNGMEQWNISFNREPVDLDCSIIDVNLDGVIDCLVFGSSFLKAIDSTTGQEFWDFHNSSKNKLTYHLLHFPLTIYDLDGDNVKELLTFCSYVNVEKGKNSDVNIQNYLVIVSGRTGHIIDTPLQVKLCSGIHNFMFENSSTISYMCYNSTGKESPQTISLNKLSKTSDKITTKNLSLSNLEVLHQHQKDSNSIAVNGHRLVVENRGHCPENCNVLVNIKDEKSSRSNNTVYTYNDKYTYCILPTIKKPDEAATLVLKFWKWQSKENVNDKNNNFSDESLIFKGSRKATFNNKSNKLKNVKTLDNEMLSESEPGFGRVKRATADDGYKSSIEKNVKDYDVSDLYLHVIRETIIGITFNKSQPTVRNITEDNIVQICKKNQICEPDVEGQKHSLLTADLNGDGKEELITFSSRYTHEPIKKSNSSNGNWQLQSVIKVTTL